MPFIPLLIGFTVASSEMTLPTYLAYLGGSLGLMSAGGAINEFARHAPAAEESDEETPDEMSRRAAREAVDNMAKEKAAATSAVLRETARSVQPVIRQADATQARLSAEVSRFEAQNETMQREVERLTHETDTLNQTNQSAETMIASLSGELDALREHSSSVYDNLTAATEALRLGEVELSGTRRQLNILETAWGANEAHYQEEITGLRTVLENIEQAPNQAEQIQRLQQQLRATTEQHQEATHIIETHAESLLRSEARLAAITHQFDGLQSEWDESQQRYQREISDLRTALDNMEQTPNQAEQIQQLQQQLICTTEQHEEAVRTVRTYAEALRSARAQLNTQQDNTEGDTSHAEPDNTRSQLIL